MKEQFAWDPQVKQGEEWISLYQCYFDVMQDAEKVIEEVIKINPDITLKFRIMPIYPKIE